MGACCNLPKAIFYLFKGDYRIWSESRVDGPGSVKNFTFRIPIVPLNPKHVPVCSFEGFRGLGFQAWECSVQGSECRICGLNEQSKAWNCLGNMKGPWVKVWGLGFRAQIRTSQNPIGPNLYTVWLG